MKPVYRRLLYGISIKSAAAAVCLLLAALPGGPDTGAFRMESYAAEDEPKDYTISGASWMDGVGVAIAEWDKPDSATKYRLQLYRTSTKYPIGNSVTSSSNRHDFTSAISKKGTGSYFYEVTPVKGGASYKVTSEVLEVDSDVLSEIRKRLKERRSETDEALHAPGNPRWISNPNGTWQYIKDDGAFAKNEWLEWDGKWYYFDSKALMAKDWVKVNKLWYYLGTDGACWVNAVTPDGYTVNESGVWVDPATGEPMQTAADLEAPYTITAVRLSLKEDTNAQGMVRNAEVNSTASGVTVGQVTYSPPYERWTPGSEVKISVEVTAQGDKHFTDTTKYSLSNAGFTGSTGDYHTRILYFVYKPKMKLESPDGLYINGDNVLRWTRVSSAAEYKVVVSYQNEEENRKSKTIYTSGPSVDLDEYVNYDEISVKITALGSKHTLSSKAKKNSGKQDSTVAEIKDLAEFMETHTVEGKFTLSDEGNLSYRDEEGDRVFGWQELMGSWYYFDKRGFAAGPGWYQSDESNYWYYFDNEHRMMTGEVEINGTTYVLNDGRNLDIPVGAWIEGAETGQESQ